MPQIKKRLIQRGGGLPDQFKETEVPDVIKKLPSGVTINESTGTAADRFGNVSGVQDARAQARNPNAGPLNMAGQLMTPEQFRGTNANKDKLPSMNESAQQPIVQPEPRKKDVFEQISDITLKPAEIAANLLTRGAALLAGQPLPEWQNTAEQLAQTTGGKILGTATGAAAVALGGIAGAQALGVGAGTFAGATAQVKGMTAALVSKNGLTVLGIKLTVGRLILGTAALGIGRELKISNDTKAAIVSTVQTADIVNDSVRAGLISPQDAVFQYQQIESQIAELESATRTWSSEAVNWIKGGGKNNMIDIENAKLNLALKRQALLQMMFPAGSQQ